MGLNRRLIKASLHTKTRRFISEHKDQIEVSLEDKVEALRAGVEKLEGEQGATILSCFDEADANWEKYFWSCVGESWVIEGMEIDTAIERANGQLLDIGGLFATGEVRESPFPDTQATMPLGGPPSRPESNADFIDTLTGEGTASTGPIAVVSTSDAPTSPNRAV